jgi:hypothetical protein
MTFEEVLERDAQHLDDYGFFVVAVEPSTPDDSSSAWAYTVGLLDSADHPELIVAGGDPIAGGEVLHALAKDVLDGVRLEVGDPIAIGNRLGSVGAVHPVQYELDTFNTWHAMQEAGYLSTPTLTAVQIKDIHAWFCVHHRHHQADLSRPDARVGDQPRHRPNRAARRARERRKKPE